VVKSLVSKNLVNSAEVAKENDDGPNAA
jgi:hypothetical protein